MINNYDIMCNYICSSTMNWFCVNVSLVGIKECGNEKRKHDISRLYSAKYINKHLCFI